MFLDFRVELSAFRQGQEFALEVLTIQFEPCAGFAAGSDFESVFDLILDLAAFADGYYIARSELTAGDIALAAIDFEVALSDPHAGLGA